MRPPANQFWVPTRRGWGDLGCRPHGGPAPFNPGGSGAEGSSCLYWVNDAPTPPKARGMGGGAALPHLSSLLRPWVAPGPSPPAVPRVGAHLVRPRARRDHQHERGQRRAAAPGSRRPVGRAPAPRLRLRALPPAPRAIVCAALAPPPPPAAFARVGGWGLGSQGGIIWTPAHPRVARTPHTHAGHRRTGCHPAPPNSGGGQAPFPLDRWGQGGSEG